MTEETIHHGGDAEGSPEPTDNSPREEDGPQDVSQDPGIDYSEDSVVPHVGAE